MQQIVDFILELDKLKGVTRKTRPLGLDRYENSAEHSWQIAAHDAVVASHPRSFERKSTLYDWQHYIPLIERKPGALRNGAPFADMSASLQQLRGLLLKREGGDR